VTWLAAFGWGAFGAILPEVVRLYKIAQGDNPMLDLTVVYVVLSVIFVLAAGIFTVAFRPENQWKAVWVGVSFPVLVSGLLSQPPPTPG